MEKKELYVVFCNYDGCEECGNSGGHVVMASFDRDVAKTAERAHNRDEKAHYGHRFWANMETFVEDGPLFRPKKLKDFPQE